MTKDKLITLWPVIEAWKNGKTIQYLSSITNKWEDITDNHDLSFSYSVTDYRIKPEPIILHYCIYKYIDRFAVSRFYESKEKMYEAISDDNSKIIQEFTFEYFE